MSIEKLLAAEDVGGAMATSTLSLLILGGIVVVAAVAMMATRIKTRSRPNVPGGGHGNS